MGKLSRYKKNPPIKLPSLRTKKLNQDDAKDEDDDFLPDKRVALMPQVSSEKAKDHPKNNLNESYSQYFKGKDPETPENDTSLKNGTEELPHVSQAPSLPACSNNSSKVKDKQSNVNKMKTQTHRETNKKPQHGSSALEASKKFHEPQPLDKSAALPAPEECKVVCPFCWKKLNDKLQGTTHVKSCAKNLPTARVIEAIELQEKQVQEWERLGIAYPGFSTATKESKKKAKTGSTKFNRRRKGNKADADLELALALSASLHEEMESRNKATNEFLAQNGLPFSDEEKSPQKAEKDERPNVVNQTKESGKANSCRIRLPKPSKPAITMQVGGRKTKKMLMELPLHRTSKEERAAIIGTKLNQIMENTALEEFENIYVRDELDYQNLSIPDRLKKYEKQNNGDKLWSLSCTEGNSGDPIYINKATRKYKLAVKPKLKDIHEVDEESSEAKCSAAKDHCRKKTQENYSTDIESGDNNQVHRGTDTLDNYSNPQIDFKAKEPRGEKFDMLPLQIPHLSPVLKSFLLLLETQVDTDLIIKTKDDKYLRCHKLFIQARCPSLLQIDTIYVNNVKCIPLTEFSVDVVRMFLVYIYCGEYLPNFSEVEDEMKILCDRFNVIWEPPSSNNASVSFKMHANNMFSVSTQTDCLRDSPPKTIETLSSHPADVCLQSSPVNEEPISRTPVAEECVETESISSSVDLFDCSVGDDEMPSQSMHPGKTAAELQNQKVLDGNVARSTTPISEIIPNKTFSSPDPFDTNVLTTPVNNGGSCNNNVSVDSFDLMCQTGSPQNMLRITTPDENSSGQNKRSRNGSPVLTNGDELSDFDENEPIFTITQAMEIHEAKERGEDIRPLIKQAKKKQKLSCDNYNNESENVEVSSFRCNDVSTPCRRSSRISGRSRTHNSVLFNNFVNSDTTVVDNVHNELQIKNLNSELNEPEVNSSNNSASQNSEVDNWADDSLFAQIPENMLHVSDVKVQVASTPLAPKPVVHVSVMDEQFDLQASKKVSKKETKKSKVKLPKTKKKDEVVDKVSENGRGSTTLDKMPSFNPKGKQSKEKSKIEATKVPCSNRWSKRGMSLSQSTVEKTPEIHKTDSPQQNPNVTPMLNYSTIDTPILKRELDRYGLKPLPRTKAKVLLKHIYKETHKV